MKLPTVYKWRYFLAFALLVVLATYANDRKSLRSSDYSALIMITFGSLCGGGAVRDMRSNASKGKSDA